MSASNKREASLISHVQELRSQLAAMAEKQASDAVLLEKTSEIVVRLEDEKREIARAQCVEAQRAQAAREIITKLRAQVKSLENEQTHIRREVCDCERSRSSNCKPEIVRCSKVNCKGANNNVEAHDSDDPLEERHGRHNSKDTAAADESHELNFAEWKARNKDVCVVSSLLEPRESVPAPQVSSSAITHPLRTQHRLTGWDDAVPQSILQHNVYR
jgi:hypothetical protein